MNGRSVIVRPHAEVRGPNRRPAIGSLAARYGVVAAFALFIVVMCIVRPSVFPTWQNAQNILTNAAVPLILALVVTIPMIMGDFDLSFAAAASAISGVVTMLITHNHGVAVTVAAALGCGVLVGTFNGVVIAWTDASAFVLTLAVGAALQGLELAVTAGQNIFIDSASFLKISDGKVAGVSNSIIVPLAIAIILWFMARHTVLGRYMHAVGGNREAAYLSGVNVRLVRAIAFVIVGVGAAIAAVFLTSSASAYSAQAASGTLLPAYAGVFIGASVLSAGRFHVWGTYVGVIFLGTIQTGLTEINMPSWASYVIQGALLMGAILLSRIGAGARRQSAL